MNYEIRRSHRCKRYIPLKSKIVFVQNPEIGVGTILPQANHRQPKQCGSAETISDLEYDPQLLTNNASPFTPPFDENERQPSCMTAKRINSPIASSSLLPLTPSPSLHQRFYQAIRNRHPVNTTCSICQSLSTIHNTKLNPMSCSTQEMDFFKEPNASRKEACNPSWDYALYPKRDIYPHSLRKTGASILHLNRNLKERDVVAMRSTENMFNKVGILEYLASAQNRIPILLIVVSVLGFFLPRSLSLLVGWGVSDSKGHKH